MYLIKTPLFVQNLFPNFTWKIPTADKRLFLTFDDGPIPEVTNWILEQLAAYNAKATFFCVGENILRHPDLFRKIREKGHSVGNHTLNHLNGWASDNIPYFHNVRNGASLAQTELFRPPYGRLKPKQAQFLQRHYRVVMWDVLSGDFDQSLSGEQCFQNVAQHAGPGSIVVFHDSLKAIGRLEYALPQTLAHFSGMGYRFEALNEHKMQAMQPALQSA